MSFKVGDRVKRVGNKFVTLEEWFQFIHRHYPDIDPLGDFLVLDVLEGSIRLERLGTWQSSNFELSVVDLDQDDDDCI
jgi:hypothetical protein